MGFAENRRGQVSRVRRTDMSVSKVPPKSAGSLAKGLLARSRSLAGAISRDDGASRIPAVSSSYWQARRWRRRARPQSSHRSRSGGQALPGYCARRKCRSLAPCRARLSCREPLGAAPQWLPSAPEDRPRVRSGAAARRRARSWAPRRRSSPSAAGTIGLRAPGHRCVPVRARRRGCELDGAGAGSAVTASRSCRHPSGAAARRVVFPIPPSLVGADAGAPGRGAHRFREPPDRARRIPRRSPGRRRRSKGWRRRSGGCR